MSADSPLSSFAEQPNSFTILIVDDQEEALLSTRLLLEMDGYQVRTASSGSEALALFVAHRMQLLIVDYFMPGMNGEELVRAIRQQDTNVQILLQTGYSGEKPPRQMLRELEIQGYHDKLDGPERLLMWIEVARKTSAQLQKIKATERALAVSRDQLRRLSARLFHMQEEERAQIGRELHDHLGQLHAAIAMDVEWARRHCPPELQTVCEPLQEAFQLVQEAQLATRRLSVLLRPGELDKLGLTAALQEHTSDFARRSGIEVRFHCADTRLHELPTEMALTVYRIVQEALTNVVRHAAATKVVIEVQRLDTTYEVAIQDNGSGFLLALDTPTGGLGIVGMQERARLVGGELQIRSAPGAGTTVVVALPLPPNGWK